MTFSVGEEVIWTSGPVCWNQTLPRMIIKVGPLSLAPSTHQPGWLVFYVCQNIHNKDDVQVIGESALRAPCCRGCCKGWGKGD